LKGYIKREPISLDVVNQQKHLDENNDDWRTKASVCPIH
jgi:hypothetical protein